MSLNILVVDDSSVTRAMIVKTLKISGLPVNNIFQAANGQEGLDVLKNNKADMAIVDINMPIMNGEEMINKIREDENLVDLPVVVVSTEGSKTRIERLMQKGAIFIHKPFEPETIREIISTITGASYDISESETDF